MVQDEDYRTAVFGKTERTVGWEGDGDPAMIGLLRHCARGNPQQTDMPDLKSLSHSFTLDCNVYVGSRVAGERVMRGIRTFLEEVLQLRVNAAKSAVARPWVRKFLGFSFSTQRETRLRIAPQSVQRLTERVRELLRSGHGRSLSHTIETLNPLLRGWIGYFQLTQSKRSLEELDGWIRRRLRCLLWRQWKQPRTRYRKLRSLGLEAEHARRSAGNGRGPWWNAGAQHLNLSLPAAYFMRLGLVSLLREQQRLQCVR